MLTPTRTDTKANGRAAPAPPRAAAGPRQRLFWTIGNLLMFAGIYLLLYVGGIYVQADYMRLAARGDNSLEVPRTTISAAEALAQIQPIIPAAASAPVAAPAAASAPVAASAASAPAAPAAASAPPSIGEGQIAAAPPSAAQLAHISTVERIVIPSIALDAKVIEVGWSVQEIDGKSTAVWDVAEYAVGQHRGSANPGEGGNIVMAGHVGGYGHVFRDLFYVHPGDQITIYSGGQEHQYVVQKRLIVDEEGVSSEQRAENARLIEPTDSELVTLITCWPAKGPDKFTQRVVVQALPVAPAAPADAGPDTAN